MKLEKLTELIEERINGEWGQEPNPFGVKVIRTTNFTNEGKLDLSNVVERDIQENKIEKKALKYGDIIIEKSGGSPTQPVGRVVFFEIDSNEKYLCNNFTTILRPKNSIVHSKYLLYQMLYQHKIGRTKKYQNKTTGIHNLNLEKYLQEKIVLPPLPDQLHIANLLSKAENLISQRKESIRLLDEFLKSTFLEMFGDPVSNEKGFDICYLSELGTLDRGVSKARPRNSPELLGGPYPLIQTGDVTNSGIYITTCKQTYSELGLKQSKMWSKGTMLITIAANIAQTSIISFDACFPDSVVGFVINSKKSNVFYVHFLFKFFQALLESRASQTAQKNINLEILRNLKVPCPALDLQIQFAQIVEKTEALKTQYQQSLKELENLYGSLIQRAFRGELGVKEEGILMDADTKY